MKFFYIYNVYTPKFLCKLYFEVKYHAYIKYNISKFFYNLSFAKKFECKTSKLPNNLQYLN